MIGDSHNIHSHLRLYQHRCAPQVSTGFAHPITSFTHLNSQRAATRPLTIFSGCRMWTMTPILAHNSTESHQPIDSTESADFMLIPSPPSYADFPLFASIDDDEYLATSHIPQPLDLSVIGNIEGEWGLQDSRISTPYDNSHHSATDFRFLQGGAFSPNPRLRVQQSTSNAASSPATPPPMHAGGNWAPAQWSHSQDQGYLSPTGTAQTVNTHGHKRLSSESSVASTGPDSPYTQSSSYPHIVDSDTLPSSSPQIDTFDTSFQQNSPFEKPLYYQQPSPLSFMTPDFQSLQISSQDARAMMARQDMSYTNAAQQRSNTNTNNGSMGFMTSTPKLDRTVSDAVHDSLYDPSQSASTRANQQNYYNYQQQGSQRPSMFNDRLHEAQNARSQTPSTDMSRGRSPFPDYASEARSVPHPSGNIPYLSAGRIREQEKLQQDARVHEQHDPAVRQNAAAAANTTVSPKQVLDPGNFGGHPATENAKFPQHTPIKQEPSGYAAPPPSFVTLRGAPVNGLPDANTNTRRSNNDYTTRATTNFSSTQPSYHTHLPLDSPNMSYPFVNQIQMRRQSSNMRNEQTETPIFPPSLTSMESTKSESSREPNVRPPAFRRNESSTSQQSSLPSPRPRPQDTTAGTGSFTCTAPRCNARFATSSKLQKHKKEAHRPSPQAASPRTPTASTTQRATSQAVGNSVSKNNGGPEKHRCERINPTTGRPCNTQFSRSYDLTRHEETIHNINKKKVKCDHCQEEKTFSRSDALTRHMRVVHPDISEHPGSNRNKRRG